jgi:Co/Zn/Cd efflux system component
MAQRLRGRIDAAAAAAVLRAAAGRRHLTTGTPHTSDKAYHGPNCPLSPGGDNGGDAAAAMHAADLRASRLGLGVDSVLAVAKGAAGLASGSAALTADAAHSAADMLSSAVGCDCMSL